jgi:pimeloyl-ACP methyl ester carboxylesterase
VTIRNTDANATIACLSRIDSLYLAERNARYPVLLVHGYAATESVWMPLRRALGQAGSGHIVSLNYNSFATDPVAVSAELTHQALRTLAAAGAPRVHLVGHSLGGLIIRRALAASAALSLQTASAVTIASPHGGAPLARIAPGRCARIMHRGPRSVLPRADAPGPVRWLVYYSDADRVVSPASARLDDPRYGAANVLIPDCGHLTICRDVRLIQSLVPELIHGAVGDVTLAVLVELRTGVVKSGSRSWIRNRSVPRRSPGPWRGCGPAAPSMPRPGARSPRPGAVFGAVLDEHQRVQPLEQHRFYHQEVAGDDRVCLGGQELPPGRPGPPGRGIDARGVRDLPRRGAAIVYPSRASSPWVLR